MGKLRPCCRYLYPSRCRARARKVAIDSWVGPGSRIFRIRIASVRRKARGLDGRDSPSDVGRSPAAGGNITGGSGPSVVTRKGLVADDA